MKKRRSVAALGRVVAQQVQRIWQRFVPAEVGTTSQESSNALQELEGRVFLAGTGLKGTYYPNPDFSGTPVEHSQEQVKFDWPGSPISGFGFDYSIVWTGEVQALSGEAALEKYYFTVKAEDGARLFVDGRLVLDKLDEGGEFTSSAVELEPGEKYDIRLEYVNKIRAEENTASERAGRMHLKWRREGASQPSVIPSAQLYSGGTASPQASGTGLRGRYYPSLDFSGTAHVRLDTDVNFKNPTYLPTGFLPVANQGFSAVWSGTVQPGHTGTYTFFARGGGSTQLWVNGQMLVSHSPDTVSDDRGDIWLRANEKYDIKLVYIDTDLENAANVKLQWQGPNTAKQIIPEKRLYPASLSYNPLPSSGSGTGLRGFYYENDDLTTLKGNRVDNGIDENWNPASSAAPFVTAGQHPFSVMWVGDIEPQHSESYTFHVETKGNVRLWVGDRLVVDCWDGRGTQNGSIPLEKGKRYSIKLAYSGSTKSKVGLYWASASQPFAKIPSTQLYPAGTSNPMPGPGSGTGVVGSYYNGTNIWNGVPATANKTASSPPDPGVDSDWAVDKGPFKNWTNNFSVRWSGQVQPRFSEVYTFTALTASQDRVKLIVDGKTLFDSTATYNSGSIVLKAGQKHDFELWYADLGGNSKLSLTWSSPSQPEQAIPTSRLYPVLTPAAPTNLNKTVIGAYQVNLSWSDQSTNERAFQVWRKKSGESNWSLLATKDDGTTSHSDMTVEPGITYEYKVNAINAYRASTSSNTVSATTPAGTRWGALPANSTPSAGSWNPGVDLVGVRAADLDGDHKQDFVGWTSSGARWVGLSKGRLTFSTAQWSGWGFVPVNVVVGDFNGDGLDDIAGAPAAGNWQAHLSNGADLSASSSWTWSASSGLTDVVVGDFNGDGRDDLAGHNSSGQWYVAQSGGTSFTSNLWATWTTSALNNIKVGDFDGDGRHDLAGYDTARRVWNVGISSGTTFGNQAFTAGYGTQGYVLADGPSQGVEANTQSLPSYASVSIGAHDFYIWESSSSNLRSLRRPSGSDRFAATWYVGNQGTFDIDVQLTDGQQHRVSVYMRDFEGANRAQIVSLVDGATGEILDTRFVSDYFEGRYVGWDVSGHVKIRVTHVGNANAVISGVFIDPASPADRTVRFGDASTRGNWNLGAADWTDAHVGDFNGDQKDDLIGRASGSNTWNVALSNGAAFTPESRTSATGLSNIRVGDLDGDGRDDLLAQNGSSPDWYAQLSKPTGSATLADHFEPQSAAWIDFATGTTLNGAVLADFNDQVGETLKAFEYVYNNIEMSPYPGHMKSPQAVRETGSGNDFDQAQLLIEMLSTAGVSAELQQGGEGSATYTGGTVGGFVSVDAETVRRWLGVASTTAAASILKHQMLGGIVIGNRIYFQHTWVMAYLPGSDGLRWRPLDPSWKFKDIQGGLRDGSGNLVHVASQHQFDFNSYFSKVRKETPFEFYRDQIADWLADNYPGKSLADVAYDGPIVAKHFTQLPSPASLPYAASTLQQFSPPAIPSALNHSVRIEIFKRVDYDNNSFSNPLGDWTVSVPNDGDDTVTIEYLRSGGNKVVPRLRVGGVQRGNLGKAQDFSSAGKSNVVVRVTSTSPLRTQTAAYFRDAGQPMALVIQAEQVSEHSLHRLRTKLNELASSVADGKALAADYQDTFLGLAALRYLHRRQADGEALASLTQSTHNTDQVGTGFVTGVASVAYHWDLQYPITGADPTHGNPGTAYDLKSMTGYAHSIDGALNFLVAEQQRIFRYESYNSSALEHAVLEELLNVDSLSAVKGMQGTTSSERQNITPSNFSTFFPANAPATDPSPKLRLEAGSEDQIKSLVSSGLSITVSKKPVQHNDWLGTVWFSEKFDANGFSLGDSILRSKTSNGSGGDPSGPSIPVHIPPPNYLNVSQIGDPVNVNNGNLVRDENDINLLGLGLPLLFARHYDSLGTEDFGLGTGWAHSYSDRLEIDMPASGQITWKTSDGLRHVFRDKGNGYWSPTGLFGTLIDISGGGYEYADKHGMVHAFDASGRLIQIRDRNGNSLAITYVSNSSGNAAFRRISTVQDGVHANRKLTFTYTGDSITKITDYTGRYWTYSYDQMTDPGTSQDSSYLESVAGPAYLTSGQSGHVPPMLQLNYRYFEGGPLHGLLEQIEDMKGGGTITYRYYPNRRVESNTDPVGNTEYFAYDWFHSTTRYVDGRGVPTLHKFNDNGQTVMTITADGARTKNTWDGQFLVRADDEIGRFEILRYDDDGNVFHHLAKDGITTDYLYSSNFDLVTKMTVEDSRVTTYAYDSQGNLTRIVDPAGHPTTMAYTTNGILTSMTLPQGHQTVSSDPDSAYLTNYPLRTDGLYKITYSDAYTSTTTFTRTHTESRWVAGNAPGAANVLATRTVNYDPRGNVLEDRDAQNNAVVHSAAHYDLLGAELGATLPEPGAMSPTSAYFNGNRIQMTDGRGKVSKYDYDLNRRQIRIVHPDGTFRTYSYDALGNVTAETDELGRSTFYLYDSRNRLQQTLFADGTGEHVVYDGAGRVIWSTGRGDPTGPTSTTAPDYIPPSIARFSYDAGDRISSKTDPGGLKTNYEYDQFGELKKETFYGAGTQVRHTTHYVRDALGRVVKTVNSQQQLLMTNHYDRNGNLDIVTRYDVTGFTFPSDPSTVNTNIFATSLQRRSRTEFNIADQPFKQYDEEDQFETYYYDKNGRLVMSIDRRGGITETHHDALGRVDQVTLPDPDPGNGVQTDRPILVTRYDAAGNVDRTIDPRGNVANGTPQDYTTNFAYDALNRRISQTLPEPDRNSNAPRPQTQNVFDASGNLVAEIDALGRSMLHRYDPLNRIVFDVMPDPDATDLTPAPRTRFDYDAAGNLTARVDASGNRTVSKYDALHRLTEVTAPDPDGNPSVGLKAPITRYDYDIHGDLWHVTRVDVDAVFGQNQITTYQYDPAGRRTTETLPDPDPNVTGDQPITTYVYDGLGQLWKVIDALGNAPGGVVADHTTLFEYDRVGRKTKQTLPKDENGQTPITQYFYDAAGNLWKVIDPKGTATPAQAAFHTVEYTYDLLNRVTKETHPDADGNTATSDTVVVDYGYDLAGNLQSVKEGDRPATVYDYDTLNRRVKQTEPAADASHPVAVTSYRYDLVGNVVAVVSPLGNVSGATQALRDLYTTSFTYDSLSRKIRDTYADLNPGDSQPAPFVQYSYDSVGNLLAMTDALGHTTAYIYDGLDRQIKVIEPDPDGTGSQASPVTTYAYDAMGNIRAMTNPRGNESGATPANFTTTYGYDGLNRKISETAPVPVTGEEAPITRYKYDVMGRLWKVIDPLGNKLNGNAALHTTEFTYDGLGRKLTETLPDADGNTITADVPLTRFHYDLNGNLISITDPEANDSTFQYDNLNRLKGTANELNHSDSTFYDKNHNVIAVVDRNDRLIKYTYDDLNRKTREQWILSPTTMSAQNNGSGGSTVTVDLADHAFAAGDAIEISGATPAQYNGVFTITGVSGGAFTYTINGAQNLSAASGVIAVQRATQAPNNVSVTSGIVTVSFGSAHGYNIGDVIEIAGAAQPAFNGAFKVLGVNGNSLTYQAADASGTATGTITARRVIRTINFTYDLNGRLIRVVDPDSTYRYDYDALNRLKTVDTLDTPYAPRVQVESGYDIADRRDSLTVSYFAGSTKTNAFTNSYAYDGNDRLTRLTQSVGGSVNKRVDFTYLANGFYNQIKRFNNLTDTTPAVSATYGYDRDDRITSLNYGAAASYTWHYDVASRIDSASTSSTIDGDATYLYDANHQLTSANHSAGALPNESYDYDGNGNRDSSAYSTDSDNRLDGDGTYAYEYDGEGNLIKRTTVANGTGLKTVHYTWDFRNRLTHVLFKDDSGTATKLVRYTYDALDHRIAKEIDPDVDGDYDSIERYAYAQDEIAVVFDSTGAIAQRYLHGQQPNEILAEQDSAAVRWMLPDHQGSIRDVVNSSGSKLYHLAYDSFGMVTTYDGANNATSIPSGSVRHRYTGHEADAETGLHYQFHRYYDPRTGRFISQDPVGFDAGDSNLYRYVGNNPLTHVDPNGLSGLDVFGPIVSSGSDFGSSSFGFDTGSAVDFDSLYDFTDSVIDSTINDMVYGPSTWNAPAVGTPAQEIPINRNPNWSVDVSLNTRRNGSGLQFMADQHSEVARRVDWHWNRVKQIRAGEIQGDVNAEMANYHGNLTLRGQWAELYYKAGGTASALDYTKAYATGFVAGAGKGAYNVGVGVANAGKEIGYMARDVGNDSIYILSDGEWGSNKSWSSLGKALDNGQITVGEAYKEMGVSIATAGTYNQIKAGIDFYYGEITEDEFSQTVGSTGLFQISGGLGMRRTPTPRPAPAPTPRTFALKVLQAQCFVAGTQVLVAVEEPRDNESGDFASALPVDPQWNQTLLVCAAVTLAMTGCVAYVLLDERRRQLLKISLDEVSGIVPVEFPLRPSLSRS